MWGLSIWECFLWTSFFWLLSIPWFLSVCHWYVEWLWIFVLYTLLCWKYLGSCSGRTEHGKNKKNTKPFDLTWVWRSAISDLMAGRRALEKEKLPKVKDNVLRLEKEKASSEKQTYEAVWVKFCKLLHGGGDGTSRKENDLSPSASSACFKVDLLIFLRIGPLAKWFTCPTGWAHEEKVPCLHRGRFHSSV